MANVIFGRAPKNVLLGSGTTMRVVNSSGSSVSMFDPQYPFTNLVNPDRYSVWSTGNSTTSVTADMYVQYIFGGSIPVAGGCRYWGWSGLRYTRTTNLTVAPTYYLSALEMMYTTIAPPSNPLDVNWTTTAAFASNPQNPDGMVDSGLSLPAGITGVQFKLKDILVTGPSLNSFTLGSFFLFQTSGVYDLGTTFIYSPGSSRVVQVPQIRVESANGAPHVTDLSGGFFFYDVNMQFRSVNTSTRTNLFLLARETLPIVYRDHIGSVFQFLPDPGGLSIVHAWGPPDLWDIELRGRTLI